MNIALALATRGYICPDKGNGDVVFAIKPSSPVMTEVFPPELEEHQAPAPRVASDIVPDLKPSIRSSR